MSTTDSLTDVYVYENSQLLEQLEEMLLDSEKQGVLEKSHIDEIFRVMHTIKGSSAMMGYEGLTKLAHSMEDMFAPLRQDPNVPMDIWEPIISLVLECIDFFKDEIAKVQDGLLPDGEVESLHQRAVELLHKISGEPAAEAPAAKDEIVMPGDAAPAASLPSAQAAPPADGPLHYYKALLRFTNGCSMESVRAFAVVNSLEGRYTRIAHEPQDLNVNCDEEIVTNGFRLYLESPCPGDEIEACLSETLFLQSLEFSEVSAESLADVFGGEAPAPAPAPATEASAAPQPEKQPAPAVEAGSTKPAPAPKAESKDGGHRATTQNFLSVNVGKVDKLMALVGEIVTAESMVTKHPEIANLKIESFEKQARRLVQLTDELQDVVMSIRMVPISSTFHKMQRIVRDMSHNTGKEAELVLIGEQTEVDKNVIENLSDPLMHMIRNSMDHGLESRE